MTANIDFPGQELLDQSMSFKNIFILIYSLFLLTSCGSTQTYDSSSAEGAFKEAESFAKDKRFDEAIIGFNTVKNKFPYSRYASLAELKIADTYFAKEAFIEAQTAYQVFKDFRPKHEKIDYVTYRLALSYFMQLPSTIDRDLTIANNAILYFDEVINSHPNSSWAPKSRESKEKALGMLAAKELYIADFYFKQMIYDSALGRYEDLLKKYPTSSQTKKALYGAALSAFKHKDLIKARNYFGQLTKQYANSSEAKKARDKIGNQL